MEMVVATAGTRAGVTAVTNKAIDAATNCCVARIINFEDNHERLDEKMSELLALRVHVQSKITVAENNLSKPTSVVTQWLNRVEEINQEVTLILAEGSKQIEQKCCTVGFCPDSWWTRYRLGKKVIKKLKSVEELLIKGQFDTVADSSGPSPVQALPESETVGLDATFDKVWNLLRKDEVKIMGIYGMGGVGKTTLLKKVNNAFDSEAGKFDVVIWVVVSKEFSIRNVQKEIGRRLGLEWTEDEVQRAERIFNALRRKRYVIMLDDIWERVELEVVGIPSPHATSNNSKLIFTTRSEDVCGGMENDKKVKVPVLNWEQSWTLFQNKVGQEALNSHPEIPKLAKEVAKECHGLPLALIVIGRAMTTKKTPPEWSRAIKTLRKHASDFSGMEHNVLAKLKFSYDNLESESVKNCFTYFSLYPEDDNVSKMDIIHHWIGEGFLDDQEDMDDAMDEGHDVIGRLKAACLLESGNHEDYVKMHDVVRDLALWIGRECGGNKSKILVQAGVGFTRAPGIGSWKEAERISLMDNNIRELSGIPKCDLLLTLLLQDNWQLTSLPAHFFQYMPCLRVLNLEGNMGIERVPESIGSLIGLRYLNLRFTQIKELPEDMRNLVELRHLNLSETLLLENIPGGMISHFSKLQFLGFYCSGALVEGSLCHPSIEDLESLEHLRKLGITMTESQMLSSVLLSQKLCSCITKIYIHKCKGLTRLSLASSSSIFRNVKKLQTLQIVECLEMEEMEINSATENYKMRLLASLRYLEIHRMGKLSITWTETRIPIHFEKLSHVEITSCGLLRDLSWLVLVPFLKFLYVEDCAQVEAIILHSEFSRTTVDNQTIFSRLGSLNLRDMPNLKRIAEGVLPLPCLEDITVYKCPLLKKLPFAANSTKKPLLQIKGQAEWFNALQWEDQTVSSSFQPFFEEYVE